MGQRDDTNRAQRALKSAIDQIPVQALASLGVYAGMDTTKPPTGRCHCSSREVYHHDAPDDLTPVSCLACGNHWYERNGTVQGGPPFTPYLEILWSMGERQPPLARLAAGARARAALIRSVPQFTWWKDPQFNPLMGADLSGDLPWITAPAAAAEAAERYLRDVFGARYQAGEVRAIFDCVACVPSAFEAPWVARQVTQWRRLGTPEARKSLNRLYAAAADDAKGKRAGAWERIKQDLAILAFLTENENESTKVESVVRTAENRFGTSRSAVFKIRREYKPFFDAAVMARFRTKRAAVAWLQSLTP